ncbi:hypothetical protein [Cellulomonas oligotrophica]|uniref:Glycosyltransferase RgtA/B/C/D-like domain-containing protein n=1 Tax=Cellulomonas oligotrophica TaxID=931536 RepID=A0A7Y9FEE6_9CELL|nr:hypothetical protein [Cellulomonas oligotrophica]NYD85709.1 hypothetical protein [Cellulomonas oligotrophica]GIG31283.1 hypothetical protein Col01nite_04420 [Cellulomonas oligotrophica]
MASPAWTLPASTIRYRQAADAWPVRPAHRWSLRLVYFVPLAALAWWALPGPEPVGPNAALAARGALVVWGDTDLGWVGEVWPPLAAGLAALLGQSGLGYVLVAAAVVAFSLQGLASTMVREGFGGWATSAVIATVMLAPPTTYLVATDLQSVLGLALLVTALAGIASFVERGSTEAGFRAGLALGVAVMVDPAAWPYALTLGLVAPFFARHAGRRGPSAQLATVAVLLFPPAAAMGFWWYLSWWFSPTQFGGLLEAGATWFPGGVGPAAQAATGAVLLGIAASPLFLVAAWARAVREPWSLIAPAIAVVGLWTSLWLGVRQPGGQTYLLLVVLYVTLLAVRRPTGRRQVVIVVTAAVQLVLVWWVSLTAGTPLTSWLRGLLG